MRDDKETPVSPIGPSVSEELAEVQRDPVFQADLDKVAPYEEIAEKVILGRTLKGYTQQQLADLVETSYSQISRIESGRHLPDTITLDKLGRVLEVEFTLPLKGTVPARRRTTRSIPSWSPSPRPVAMMASSRSNRTR